jgi:membrane protein
VVIVATLAALYGILGLGQAAQNSIHVAYAIPRNSRPNPFLSRLHSGLLLMVAGLVLVVVATITSIAANAEVFGVAVNFTISILVNVASALLTAAVLALMMRVALPESERFRDLLPGALATAIMWQLLQRLGRVYVSHVVARATDLNGLFALTLGLLALLYVAANMGVIGIQINVVLTRHLWPRALLTPFTDAVELTEADRRAYVAYAQAQRHKGFERVDVTFDKGDE